MIYIVQLFKTNEREIMKIQEIEVKNYLTKSKLPESDYVINPYVGCPHGCKYCYAEFMKRFTGHNENWGEFLDVKICGKKINSRILVGKRVFFSSVTDCYNPFERKYGVTKKILEQLIGVNCIVYISTKSSLVLRDIDLLSKLSNLKVAISLNTLDDCFRKDMDRASSVDDRIKTLRELHENGIYTVLFMSPIFPEITNWRKIIEETRKFVNEYWFEELNLRGTYKNRILSYINTNYQEYYGLYKKIYINKERYYCSKLENDIIEFCNNENIKYKIYFDHEKLVKNKMKNSI